MVLSNKQSEELHKAILGYLKSNNLMTAYAALQTELKGLTEDPTQHGDLLERKWTSLIRLQKRVMDLETANSSLRQDLENAGRGKRIDTSLALPRAPPRATLLSHRDAVTCVRCHPLYTLVFTASDDATIKVWDTDTAQLIRTLTGHTDAVSDIAFDPKGALMVSGSADMSVKLWDISSDERYECVKTLSGHDHTVSAVSVVPNGEMIISASRDKTIKVWDATSGYCLRTISGHEQWVRQCIITPVPINGAYMIASGGNDQTVRLWSLKTGECLRILREHTHVIECLAFSPAAADTILHQWRTQEKVALPIALITDSNSATDAQKSGASDEATPSSNGVSKETSIASTTSSSTTDSDNSSTLDGGLYLLSGSRDKTIRLWETLSGVCIRTLSGHDNWVRSVLFHPSGRFVVSCADDKSIRCWDVTRNGKVVTTLTDAHTSFVSSIDWGRGFPLLVSGSVDHSVHVWDCR